MYLNGRAALYKSTSKALYASYLLQTRPLRAYVPPCVAPPCVLKFLPCVLEFLPCVLKFLPCVLKFLRCVISAQGVYFFSVCMLLSCGVYLYIPIVCMQAPSLQVPAVCVPPCVCLDPESRWCRVTTSRMTSASPGASIVICMGS